MRQGPSRWPPRRIIPSLPPLPPIRQRHWRLHPFHVKPKRGWIAMSSCSGNGRRKPIWWRLRRFRICGPGTSPIPFNSWRSRHRQKPGPISAAAAGFPGWYWPAPWRKRLKQGSIWSSATPRRRLSCARRSALPIRRAWFIWLILGIVWIRITGPVDCVTARALAPLHQLVGFVEPLVKRGAKALFLKGQDVEAELTEATKYWNIKPQLHSSRTGGHGWIVELDRIERRNQPATAHGTRA